MPGAKAYPTCEPIPCQISVVEREPTALMMYLSRGRWLKSARSWLNVISASQNRLHAPEQRETSSRICYPDNGPWSQSSLSHGIDEWGLVEFAASPILIVEPQHLPRGVLIRDQHVQDTGAQRTEDRLGLADPPGHRDGVGNRA
jgi:hypothetical protein